MSWEGSFTLLERDEDKPGKALKKPLPIKPVITGALADRFFTGKPDGALDIDLPRRIHKVRGSTTRKMAPVKITRLKRERTSDAVYQILRDNILQKRFPPGERLDIRELAQKLDVSITPVKEAVNRLATEGFVVIRPRSGTFVTGISIDDVRDIFEIRRALECAAAEKVLQHASAADIQKIRDLVTKMDRPVKTEAERVHHETTNADFHETLVRLSGNRKLLEIYHGLAGYIQIARIPSRGAHWRERMALEQKEHWAILKAIEKKDRDAVVKALAQHIRRAGDSLLTELKEAESNKTGK